jgi:proteasome assembly chaperone (PAC2) family protein
MNDGLTDGYIAHEWPDLNEPVLLVNLQGFIDAGAAGAAAMATVDASINARLLVSFDPDLYIDHRERRPIMQLREGVNTGIVWPEIVLKTGRDRNGNDILLLTGSEPDMNWNRFMETVVGLAGGYGTRMMVGLGAYPAPAPHTRPSRLSVTAATAALAERVGYQRDSLDAPAGVMSGLELAFDKVGIPALCLWAQVPHYVSNSPYPAAVSALLDGLHNVAGIVTDGDAIRDEAREHAARLDQLVAANLEHLAMVRQLESVWDQSTVESPAPPVVALDADGPLPSGDELAAELERFLRDRDS